MLYYQPVLLKALGHDISEWFVTKYIRKAVTAYNYYCELMPLITTYTSSSHYVFCLVTINKLHVVSVSIQDSMQVLCHLVWEL